MVSWVDDVKDGKMSNAPITVQVPWLTEIFRGSFDECGKLLEGYNISGDAEKKHYGGLEIFSPMILCAEDFYKIIIDIHSDAKNTSISAVCGALTSNYEIIDSCERSIKVLFMMHDMNSEYYVPFEITGYSFDDELIRKAKGSKNG